MRLMLLILLVIPFSIFAKTNLIDENEKAEDTIYIKSSINEIFASTEILQYFKNTLPTSIELFVSFPIKKEISLSKFEITIGNRKVISKIMKKEIAKEKYDESISKGNTGFISEYIPETDDYTIKIGNIAPNEFVQLQAFFYQRITSQDMSYEFNIMEKYPTFHYENIDQEKFRNKKIKAKFLIKAQSKITRLIAPFYDEKAQKNSFFDIYFDDDYTTANIYYIKNPDEQTNIDTIGKGLGGQVNKPTFYSTFCILFRTANMNRPTLFYQYNPELNETSYAINYIYSSNKINIPIPSTPDLDNKVIYTVKYEQNKNFNTPGLFILLVDQSGSMWGNSIQLVKKALLSFIEIIPKGSYFHLLGFGSHLKKYSEEPVEYNKDNIEKYKEIISEIEADLGGTNIGEPLKYIFENENYENIKLSKNIFLLTDGHVNNRDKCIDLITKNSHKFRVHAIGIGDNFDKILVERSGKVGKGSSFFVNNVENIETVLLNILIKCLRPYLIDINFKFNNYEKNLKNKIISSTVTNDFSYQDEIINFSFILDEKSKINFSENINILITAKDPINLIKENIYFKKNENIIKLSDGDEMAKMLVGDALKNNLEFIENEKREIDFATKYQILSKNTAIFAEIINENKNKKLDKNNQMTKVSLNEYKQKIFGCANNNINTNNDINYLHKKKQKKKINNNNNNNNNKNNIFQQTFGGVNNFNEFKLGGIPGFKPEDFSESFSSDDLFAPNNKDKLKKIINEKKMNKDEQNIKDNKNKNNKIELKEKENEEVNKSIKNSGNILGLGLYSLFNYYLLLLIILL